MTGRERLIKTLKGQKVDRAPIWLDDTFSKDEGRDPFTDQWMSDDPRLIAFKDFYYRHCEVAKNIWAPGTSRNLCTQAEHIHKTEEQVSGNCKEIHYVINTPKGDLSFMDRVERNISTVWRVEYPVKGPEDIEKLLSIPFQLGALDYSAYRALEQGIGDRGMAITMIDTPAITVGTLMPFQEYLMYTLTDFAMIKELTAIAYERVKQILESALAAGVGPVIRIMGSEQATPPMNRPEVYDELVVRYETQMIARIHQAGRLAGVHCHGKIKTALPKMLQMGVDVLDPVEGPPSGDIEFLEAKRVVDGRMTLAGNIQFADLEQKDAAEIAKQVRMLFSDGRRDHVWVSTSAFPMTYMSEKLYRNTMTLVEEAMRCGAMG